MPGWTTARQRHLANGERRLSRPSAHGVSQQAPRAYRAYLDGRMIGLWRSKEAAIAAAEKAALARTIETSADVVPSPTAKETIMARRKQVPTGRVRALND